ncbi:hypothetical protein PV326_009579 [Microctonus aethiopoides]|nr:hypothetical protein PV326_009579 [Microctonus aethiopoides]
MIFVLSQEDLSDPDLQDEESGEELLQQPLQGNAHPSTGNPQNESSAPTALSHLNSMLHASHPHLLSKYKMDPSEMDLLNNKSSLEALQAAMSSGGFNLPFSFPPPSAFLAPHHNNHQQISGGGVTSGGGGGGGNNSGGGTGSNNAIASSASSLSSESSQGSLRNVSEAREGTGQSQNSNSNNSQQQSTSWSFEEQFKQILERQVSADVHSVERWFDLQSIPTVCKA